MNAEDLRKVILEGISGIETGDEDKCLEFIETDVEEINEALGGGFPVGRFVEVFGLPSTAKSGLALHILAKTQQKGGLAILIDTEDAYNKLWAQRNGIDTSELLVSRVYTLEKLSALVESVIRTCLKRPEVYATVVVDSLSAPPSEGEMELDAEKASKQVAYRARVITKMIQRWGSMMVEATSKLGSHRITLILVNHAKQVIGSYYTQYTTPGGEAPKYWAATRILLSRTGQRRRGSSVVGIRVRMKVVKNKMGPEGRTAEFMYLFDEERDKWGVHPIAGRSRKESKAQEQMDALEEDLSEGIGVEDLDLEIGGEEEEGEMEEEMR